MPTILGIFGKVHSIVLKSIQILRVVNGCRVSNCRSKIFVILLFEAGLVV